MRPTPSLITQLHNGAQLWASGTFNGLDEWLEDNDIELLVNLLGRRVSRRCEWKEWDMNSFSGDWNDELGDVVEALTRALYMGKHALVHCQHGLHRTGSLIVFWLALGMISGEEVHDSDDWLDKLEEAWRSWSRGRQLHQATKDDRHGRDYEDESWKALMSYFRDMPLSVVRDMAERLQRTAQAASRNLHQSQRSQRSEQSVQSRLPLQRPTVTLVPKAPSSSAASSSTSSAAPSFTPAAKRKPPGAASSSTSSAATSAPRTPPLQSAWGQKWSMPSLPSSRGPQPPAHPPSARATAEQAYGPDWVPGAEWQSGDWACRRCGNHNWRRRGFLQSQHSQGAA